MKYKIVRDGHGRGKQVLYSSDDLLDIAQFCENKAGRNNDVGFDLGLDIDDGDLL